MKSLVKILVFSICLMAMSQSAEAKTYINGIDANYPPFAYVNEKGQADGLDVKAMDWIAKEMGFTVKHQPMDWDGIIPALLASKIDMICSGMSITPERVQRARFSDPYWTLSKVLVIKNDKSLTVDQIFNSTLKIGVQRGTSEHNLLEQKKANDKLKYSLHYYASGPLAIEDLVNGRVDAVAMDIFPAQDAVAKKRPVKITGSFVDDDTFGVAFRKSANDDTIFNLVNEGYKKLQKDPYWEELKSLYLK